MIKRLSPCLGKARWTTYSSLATAIPSLEELSLRGSPIPALTLESSPALSCHDAVLAAGGSPLTSSRTDRSIANRSISSSRSSAHQRSSSRRSRNMNSVSLSSSWCSSSDFGVASLFELSGWSTSSFSQAIRKCNFGTDAVEMVEPFKTSRDKDLESVGGVQEENDADVVVIQLEASAANVNFDGIPDLEEKLKFLETCGLGDNQLKQMRKRLPSAVKNTFLKLSVKKLIEVATFLEEEVGVRRLDFGNVLFANPYIAGSSVEDCLRPKINFLRNRGISKEQMGKMVLRSPQILTYSLEGKLLAIEQKLLEVGLKGDEVGRVFVKYPAVFGTSISKFDKNVQALRDGGITEVAKAIFRIPQIMSLSLDNKFEQIILFLRDELQLQQEQISKILSCQISILSFSVEENIRPKVGFFSKMGLGQEEIAKLVVKYPNLFCHSLDHSIKPKVGYLIKEMNLQVSELIAFPHYLSYSLVDRIIPRHEYVIKHGFSFRLSSLLSCCDNVFRKRYPDPQSGLVVD